MSALIETKFTQFAYYKEVAEALEHPALKTMREAMEEVFSAREKDLIVPLPSGERIDFPDLPLASTQGMQVPYWLFPRIGTLIPNRRSELEAMRPIFEEMWGLGISFNQKADGVALRSIKLGKTMRLRFDFNQVRSQRGHLDAQQLVLGEFLGVTPLEPDEINSRQRESLGALMVLSDNPDYFRLAGEKGFLVAKTLFGRSRLELIALPGRFLRHLVLRPDICSKDALYVLSAPEIQALLGGTKVEEGSSKIDLPAIVY